LKGTHNMGIDRRKFITLTSIAGLSVALSGCALSDGTTLEEILAMLKGESQDEQGDMIGDSENFGPVTLAITYPAGRSPNVFTSGWVFGAKCTTGSTDISNTVRWSGTGSFSPEVGNLSRPTFNSEGANTIKVSVTVGGKLYEKTVTVNAKSPSLYAAKGTHVSCPADSHGCPACPHPVSGYITTGSPNVFVNGRPAARTGDKGVHASCCGSNTFTITGGDQRILINGRPAVMIGDATQHCGGVGTVG
jgi:uncharacterized Zn-binding protein involved in type VI secretion